MKILTMTTHDLTSNYWDTYVTNINSVFGNDYSVDHYNKKYNYTVKGLSYHSLLISEKGEIVGGCTVIPYEYWIDSKKHLIGLCVDFFIVESYRTIPFIFVRMYTKLKENHLKDGLDYVVGLPNEFACHFLRKVLKWNPIGNLPCYVLPVNIGNIIKKHRYLNSLSKASVYLWTYTVGFLGGMLGTNEGNSPIRINRNNDIIEKQRYSENHKIVKLKKGQFAYRFSYEKGMNTIFIIDFYDNNKKRNGMILFLAIQYILKMEKVDLIVFIGSLKIFQMNLIKAPSRFLPQQLLLIGDYLKPNKINKKINNFKNWDFGLFNCDVR